MIETDGRVHKARLIHPAGEPDGIFYTHSAYTDNWSMLEYINQLRARGRSIEDSAVEGAVLRLRPIMMTMLVATLGLLPAAMSHAIGSDSQRPFAIVVVGGLITNLLMSAFLMPTLYVWTAREGDKLPESEESLEV